MLGGFDQMCAAVGAGAITPDTLMVSLGTATMLLVTSLEPLVDPARRLTTSCHVLPQAWSLQAPILTTGALLKWWRDQFFHSETSDPYREMDELAERVPIGAEGLLVFPYFCGGGAPWWDHSRRGAMIGLSLAHGAPHIIRAILEGVAMEVRANLEVAESLGIQIDSLRIAGGGATSDLWRGIIGDALGRPQIRLKELEVGALGAAILAGVGAGLFRDVEDGVRAMVAPGEQQEFSAANHAEYQRLYARYEGCAARLYGAGTSDQVPVDAGGGLDRWEES
jgi:xylulokinase